MTNNLPHPPSLHASRLWVFRCSDESIAGGQISILAIAEVIASVALYWGLSTHFDWPLMSFIGLIAAPLLLLRSQKSVASGVAMLEQYCKNSDDITKREKVAIVLISVLATGLSVYYLATSWLPDYAGWAMFWRAAVVGTITYAVVFLVASMVSFRVPATTNSRVIEGAILLTGVISVVVVATAMNLLAGVGVLAGAFAVPVMIGMILKGGTTDYLTLLFLPLSVLGVLIRGSIIHWIASLRHLSAGLANLPQNWRETLLVIDFCHPPELLPHAGRVHFEFSVREILKRMPAWNMWRKMGGVVMILLWYVPALTYRWCLKASAWLWWPLALALSSPLERMDDKARREKTAISVGGAWRYLLPWIPAVVFAWLILSVLPSLDFLLPMLSNENATLAKKLLTLASPPALGVRYFALWLGCFLAFIFWWRTKNLKASHGKVLESPREFNDLADEDKQRFLQLARSIEKIRLLLIVTVLVLGEAYSLSFFFSIYPQAGAKIIAPWVFQIM